MNFEQARFNMIEQQIRTWDVLDPTVLALLNDVKREDFVAPSQQALAFSDIELPILPSQSAVAAGKPGQTMLYPRVEARLLQALALTGKETVYQVGAGSGYVTALLARRSNQVTASEIDSAIALLANDNLRRAGIHNFTVETRDGLAAPNQVFDAVVLCGSVPAVPDAMFSAVKPGGALFAVVGTLPTMKAIIVRKDATGGLLTTELFETVLHPLQNISLKPKFEF